MFIFNRLLVGSSLFSCCVFFAFPVLSKNSSTENTVVTPHMEVPIEAGRNVIFCSTFQIAWNDMRDSIIKEDIHLEEPLDLVRILNRGLATKADILDADYLAMVGYGEDNIADKINRALERKYGSDAPVVYESYNGDDTILAYAFLMKELLFENPFEDFKNPITFHGNESQVQVEAFGVFNYSESRHQNLHEQVEIVEYKNPRDFIVRLRSKHPDDEIILANIAPEKTLLETFEKVNWRITHSRRHSKPEHLSRNDILQIPKFDLSLGHRYSSLLNLHLLNEGFESYFVCEAKQDVRFRLDECGASVKSEGIFAIKKGPPVDFKILVFNKPFMIYLKKKDGKYPYLAIWVENAELMVGSN